MMRNARIIARAGERRRALEGARSAWWHVAAAPAAALLLAGVTLGHGRGEATPPARAGVAEARTLAGRAAAMRFAQTRDPVDADAARVAFEQALAADPGFWPALQGIGELHEALGDEAVAAAAYRRVLELAPDHPHRARLASLVARADADPRRPAPPRGSRF